MNANKAFCILLVSFSVALVGLITILYKSLPLAIANAIYVCQKTFTSAVTLPHSIPFTLSLITVIILTIGLLTLWIQILKTRLYIKRTIGKKVFLPNSVKKIAGELNLNGRIDVIKDKNRFSFCYGIIRPRICLSTGFIKVLNNEELKAVLLHESYHLRNYDPLKIVIGRAASRMLFFIPALGDIQKYYALSKEIAADNMTIKNTGKQPILSSLSKLITLNNPKFSGVAAFASSDDLEMRIKYLTGLQNTVLFRSSIFSIFLSIIVILFSVFILNAPVHAMGLNNQSMNTLYCVCPYDDRCSGECQDRLKTREQNFSEFRPYTSAEGALK
ncbi:M48 family metalloprotease [Candidatus Daviesbacteria bacterium]|nr:M48 family metalloprotease [Candidatus Daviesbacteria bacterium]